MEGVEDPATVGRRVRRWGVGKSSRGGGVRRSYGRRQPPVLTVSGEMGSPCTWRPGGRRSWEAAVGRGADMSRGDVDGGGCARPCRELPGCMRRL